MPPPAAMSHMAAGRSAHVDIGLGRGGHAVTDEEARVRLGGQAFVPGVLLALDKVRGLPAGLTIGLDALL